MRRRLGGFESAEAWTGASFAYNAVAVVRLNGRPEEASLRQALAAVQRRHPLLRARLELQGSRWSFVLAESGPVPLRRVERSGDDDWQRVAEEEINRPLEYGVAPLARCALVASPSDDAASEIVFTFHHAIVDATSGATVCRELLELCGGGAAETAASAELPARPDDRFPAPFRGLSRFPRIGAFMARRLAEEIGYLWRSRGVRSPPPAGPTSCHVLPMALGEEATAALVRRCRRRRVPLNSALNAALLLAVRHHRYSGRRAPLRYFAFPDLRPYLEPPMDEEALVSCLTTMRFTQRLGSEETFWDLAARIDKQLYHSFRRGEKYLFAMTSAGLLRMVIGFGRMRFGTVAVAYNGPLDFPATIGDLRVRSIHGFVSNMSIGAEFTSVALIFRRRLWWDFVYLDADMDAAEARAIADDIQGRLKEAADE